MQHLRKSCEAVPASTKLAPSFPISISQISVVRMRSLIGHCGLPLTDVSTLLLFSFLPLSLLTPGPCPGLYVFSSHVFWGSSGIWGWSLRLPFLLRFLMLSHHLTEMMDFQRRLKKWCATPSAWSYSYSCYFSLGRVADSGHFRFPHVRSPCHPNFHTPFGRESCMQSAFMKKGATHIHRETLQTEIALLRRNTLMDVWVHTDSVQP